MIGARPHTAWLDTVERDPDGYIHTGSDIPLSAWRLERSPMLLETSMPGVFAIGDVRSGAVKRVVSAVGDGGVGIGQVHRYLAETFAPSAHVIADPARR
jgi:thioredoxin reductase (NADPH)